MVKLLRVILSLSILGSLIAGCKEKKNTLFRLLPPDQTGITFNNLIQETDSFNILTEEYIYNGGGVGIGDFNNDSLPDIFFAGNNVPNQLYLNKGNLHFQDISQIASINVPGRWSSGVALVDINNDGWMDVYVCATLRKNAADRKNMLFINKGPNADGIPVFENQAAQYHLDDDGYSTMAAFVDYDLDGDLDVYVLTDQLLASAPTNYRVKIMDGSSPNNDRLYRNNGDGTFSNVAKEAGINAEGFGLGLAVADLNLDGWPDFYISNDYVSNDLLYINQRNGTFKNQIAEFIGHQSHFSMGNDIGDVNNDGLPDIVTLDMLPETNFRKKTTINTKSYQTYLNNEKFHYDYQYMRNMLQLNNGFDQGMKFSEVGELAGIHQTEWSWSPLLADVDNDGDRDLLITNGFPMDVTDKDFSMYRLHSGQNATVRQLLDSIPVVRIPNYAMRNDGNLSFTNVTQPWGMDKPSFSNGAAYADLDNDGDLDYVINNIDDAAFVYENTLYQKDQKSNGNNFLRLRLKNSKANPSGFGTKVTLFYDSGKTQYQEFSPFRGYLSSVEDVLHFGLATTARVDSARIIWPDGKSQRVSGIKANQVITVSYRPDNIHRTQRSVNAGPRLVEHADEKLKLLYKDQEQDKFDYNLQRTIPHKFSQSGPGMATGDVDGNGLDDVVIGGSSGQNETVFLQMKDGSFVKKEIKNPKKIEEDEGLLLFDADNDNDLDLYVVSGSLEDVYSTDAYQDRLYLNQGKGEFALAKEALPSLKASGSCVRAADYDGDGDLDLFVGGRVVVGNYPLPPESYLLENNKGKFSIVTPTVCPELKNIGMVTDALWTDFDQDGKVDLMVVGEFMPVLIFKNDGKKLTRVNNSELGQLTGWWNSITAGDFDRDGDTDYAIGNLGTNNYYQVSDKFPLRVYGKDFDNNGSIDPVLASYMRENMDQEERKIYPVHFWDEISNQSPLFRRKFRGYAQYGRATVDKLFTEKDLEGAMILEARQMASVYIENLGGEKFKWKRLPLLAQVGPINGMITDDVNGDGSLDIIAVGNDFGNEVFSGRLDALTGLVLTGNGNGSFESIPSARSGFYVPGDAKGLARVEGKERTLFIATQNRDSVRVFKKLVSEGKEFKPQPLEEWARVVHNDGKVERVEFYYGSGYLSQSSRKIRLAIDVREIEVFGGGKSRKVIP